MYTITFLRSNDTSVIQVRKYFLVRSSDELEYTHLRRSTETALIPPRFLLEIHYIQLKRKPGENIILKSQSFQEKLNKFNSNEIYLNMQRQHKHIQKSYSHFNPKPVQLTPFLYHSQRSTCKTDLQRGIN